jgi:hypothetical protein
MKRIFLLSAFLLMIGIGSSKAQLGNVLDQVSKSAQASLTSAQKQATTSTLAKLDTELIKKFGLDAAKTSVVGNTLKVLIADQDFSKLTTANKSKTASAINTATNGMLNGLGTDFLKGVGLGNLSTVVVEMVNTVGAKARLKDTFTFKK